MNEVEKYILNEQIITHNKDLVEKLSQLASEIEAKSASIFDDLMTDTEDTKKNDAIFDYSRFMHEWSKKIRQASDEVGKRVVITNETKIEEIKRDLAALLEMQKDSTESFNTDLEHFINDLK